MDLDKNPHGQPEDPGSRLGRAVMLAIGAIALIVVFVLIYSGTVRIF